MIVGTNIRSYKIILKSTRHMQFTVVPQVRAVERILYRAQNDFGTGPHPSQQRDVHRLRTVAPRQFTCFCE